MGRKRAGRLFSPAGGQHILVHLAQGIDEAAFPQAHEREDQDADKGKGPSAGPGQHFEAVTQLIGVQGDVAAQQVAEIPALIDDDLELPPHVARRQEVLHGLPGIFGHDMRTRMGRHIARRLPGGFAYLVGKFLVQRDGAGQQRTRRGGKGEFFHRGRQLRQILRGVLAPGQRALILEPDLFQHGQHGSVARTAKLPRQRILGACAVFDVAGDVVGLTHLVKTAAPVVEVHAKDEDGGAEKGRYRQKEDVPAAGESADRHGAYTILEVSGNVA